MKKALSKFFKWNEETTVPVALLILLVVVYLVTFIPLKMFWWMIILDRKIHGLQ